MSKWLYKFGKWIAEHRWLGILGWLMALVIIVTPLMINAPKFQSDLTMNGLKSLDTNDKINEAFHQDSEKASMRIVFHTNKDDGINDKGLKSDIEKALTNIEHQDDDIQHVSSPYETKQINDEKNTAIADINYVVPQTDLKEQSKETVQKEIDDLKEKHNIQIETTDRMAANPEVGGASELIGIVVAFVVLLITFGSVVAAGLPIISALIGLGTGVGIISLLTFVFDIPNVTLTLAVMIGLAVGIDYALFILFRYREIRKTEPSHTKAIGLAVGTAGSAVIFAGITVIIAVCGLSLVGIDFLAVMGFASAISVLLAVISALTLLPALISIFHKKIKVRTNQRAHDKPDTFWSHFVVGKPVLATILSIIILGLAILPVFHMRLGMPDDSTQPLDSSQHRAYELVSDEFGEGYNGQIVMLVNTKDGGSEDDINNDLNQVKSDIEKMDNVETVSPPQLNENNRYALLSIIPKEGPNTVSTNDLVYDLRDYSDVAQNRYHFDTEISGQSVINIDMSQKLNDAIPVFAGSIVILAFILLTVVFRSLLIPLKAVGGFVLSLAATLGFTTFVMQDGFLNQLLGVSQTGPLLAFLPVITIGLLFGLAIDYEIFLMSRIHEEYVRTKDNAHSIKVGIKESGPVIVAAALIMFSVFIAFAFQDDMAIKSMGISLGFGVLFDAFIVRMTLIPALTKLFGRASWYMPKWLNRILPNVDVEGTALQQSLQQERESTEHDASHQVRNEAAHVEETRDVPNVQPAPMMEEDQSDVTALVQLYRELAYEHQDSDFLYHALLEYAEKHNRSAYARHQNQMHMSKPHSNDVNDDRT
ncbi:MMPL family transporter [Staphylococcus delphini]|uniref:MMPL family transporter n=1 Tax=Staphylococcus delphini TaxID=53344 RepID=UPI000BBC59B4|nr:MMPL family transporter [Staphylococcus delphini]PCF49247.1 hypothetical protein B5C09_02540 [Staphylococcus delphini]